MNVVAIECPNCNGSIEMNADLEFGFCNYCGTKIYIPNAVQRIKGTVSLDNSGTIDNLLKRARTFEEEMDLKKAKEYYNKVLDLDALNEQSIEALKRINHSVLFQNERAGTLNFIVDGQRKMLPAGKKAVMVFEDGQHYVKREMGFLTKNQIWRFNVGTKPVCYCMRFARNEQGAYWVFIDEF